MSVCKKQNSKINTVIIIKYRNEETRGEIRQYNNGDHDDYRLHIKWSGHKKDRRNTLETENIRKVRNELKSKEEDKHCIQ